MKQESGLPVRTRLASSEEEEDEEEDEGGSPDYGAQDMDEGPMDLTKKPGKEEDPDKDRPPGPEDLWQKNFFPGLQPYLSLFLGGGGVRSEVASKNLFQYGLLPDAGDLLTPNTPVIFDHLGRQHALFRTPEGGVATLPLAGLLDHLGPKEPPPRPNSELVSLLQSRPLYGVEPEDLRVGRTPPRDLEEDEDPRRSRSCPDIPRFSDPDLVDRVRGKSDSESPVSWSTADRFTPSNKRKAEDHHPIEIRNAPITRLLDYRRQKDRTKTARPPSEHHPHPAPPPPVDTESTLEKLCRSAPLSLCAYTYLPQMMMMQRMSPGHHDLQKGHLPVAPQSLGAPPVSSGRSSPSPATTPLSASPPSANGDSRKNARVLTGKHVRHGTGASPSTLLTLRQKIQERQKAKEMACAQSCAQQDNKHKDMARKRTSSKVRLVKQ